MTKTITREYLSNSIKKEIGLPRSESLKLVALILDSLSLSIKKDKILKLSSLGTFKVKNKNSRMGRNPKTGKDALISARSVITFTASEKLKNRLNIK
ncbi:HU family DNA-binding protein [Alphaproteobacteria bacterium]|jgi:integration host factor subunit alpha|nr:HU family DNA-binding protein [Alphaproteobacteria bacterium]|tara:strand:+ start:78 stop:368 length:291 start_codon:yes stop_codon:yes gene_type:complete